MIIRLTSTLTEEDENIVASALLAAIASFLDLLPFSYALNIETISGHQYRHSRPAPEAEPAPASR